MKTFSITFILTIVLSVNSVFSQHWKQLNRQQKDSVIQTYFNKGNNYVAFGFTPSGGLGTVQSYFIRLEPAYGYFFRKRQLLVASLIFEKAKIQDEGDYRRHSQFLINGYYRYYLPERRTYTNLFVQCGIHTGKFVGIKSIGSSDESIAFYVLNFSLGIGISIPINKFNIELAIKKDYRLLNQNNYNDFFGGDLSGFLNFSFLF
jgi:hypothetical protein